MADTHRDIHKKNEYTGKTPLAFTTSWDDGHCLDFHVANLLSRHGLQGTFYVNKARTGSDFLLDCHIQDLARHFEVGAHTLTHPNLTKLDGHALQEEIKGSKAYLEDILQKEVIMFCYPKGMYSEKVKKVVQDANFSGARTVENYRFAVPQDPFEMGTSLQVYPWPLRKKDSGHYMRSMHIVDPLKKDFRKFAKTHPPLGAFVSWQGLARHLFRYALEHGNYFHLWGHSWEIEKYNMWDELEQFFSYIEPYLGKHVSVCTNGEIAVQHQ